VRNKEANNPGRSRDPARPHLEGAARPGVRRGDDEFFAIAKWVVFALIEAEEYGITQATSTR
jgi:general L-amino acid transport system substrate-binding protein